MNQYTQGYREKYAARRVALWMIRRDYLRGLREREEILEASAAPPDGQPRGTKTGDPTGQKAVQLSERGIFCDMVDRALKGVPVEHRAYVRDAVIYGKPYPDYAAVKTYQRWTRKFLDNLVTMMETRQHGDGVDAAGRL